MRTTRTFGRRPTIGEIRAYYGRRDVLEFLYEACRLRTVNVSFRGGSLRQGLYQLLQPRSLEQLRQTLGGIFRDWVEKAYRRRAAREGVDVDEIRPDMFGFLSLHAHAVIGDKKKPQGFDLILESDLQGWRRSFEELTGVIRMLEEFEVCFRIKYSGVRSLHLLVPWDALPKQFKGRPLRNRRKWLLRAIRRYCQQHCGMNSADSPGFLRLAYSLNEDNGLVSLPIDPVSLPAFRPWQANLHSVAVDKPWHGQVPRGASRKTLSFLREVFDRRGGNRVFSFGLDMEPPARAERTAGEDGLEERLRSQVELERLEAAWQFLNASGPVRPSLLEAGLTDPNPDVRWYTTEALQKEPDRESLRRATRMLLDDDQFVRISAGDALTRAAGVDGGVEAVVEAVEARAKSMSFPTFLAMFFDVTYVVEKQFASRKPEMRDALLEAGGRAVARLLERAIEGAEEGDGERWNKRLRVWGQWIGRLRSSCARFGFPSGSLMCPVIGLCLERLGREMGEAEIGSRLFAGVLERVHARQAAALAALTLAGEKLGARGVESPELAVDEEEREILLTAVAAALDGLSPAALRRLIIRFLRDGGDSVRLLAGEVLRKLDSPPEEFLQIFVEMARDENSLVRASCVRVLGELDRIERIPTLVAALGDGDKGVRHTAVAALRAAGLPAVPALVAALEDGNGTLASHAALALGELEAAEAVEALGQALAKRTTGHNAARALGRIGGSAAVAALISALDCEHRGVRLGAIDALARIRDPSAAPALLRLLEDDSTAIRSRAMLALGELEATEAVPALHQGLRDGEKGVRSAALKALSRLGTPEAVAALIGALDEETTQNGAIWALGRAGDPAAVPALIACLGDEGARHRGAAVAAIADLGQATPEVVEALARVLQDEDEWIGHLAAKALRRLGTPEALARLRE